MDLSLGEGGGGGARLTRTGSVSVMMLLVPAVDAAAPGVHEEVADGAQLQAQLLRDGHLHFLRGPFVLLENGDERSALQVREHQALLLGCQVPFLVLLLFLALAGCGEKGGEDEQDEERKDNGEEIH